MAYPDLPSSPTFWRCPKCANETLFLASGTAHVECVRCERVSTVDDLLSAHATAHPELAAEASAAH